MAVAKQRKPRVGADAQSRADKFKRNIFQQLLLDAEANGMKPSKNSIGWFRKFIRENVRRASVERNLEADRYKNRIFPGKMYHFKYDAKHKDTLPFWDAFPLIFPFSDVGDRFYGINFHLMPLQIRAIVLDNLHDLTNTAGITEKTKLKLSWDYLKSISASYWIRPCVRCYLKSHVRSRFIEVKATEWQIALFLPTQKIQKANQTEVYNAYREKL